MKRTGSGSPLRAVIFGIVGAVIGMGIWILIGVLTNFEIGWIAWGVGILTGFGFYYGDKRWEGRTPGFTAAAIAFVAVFTSQRILLHQLESNFKQNLKISMNDDDVKMLIADEICATTSRRAISRMAIT